MDTLSIVINAPSTKLENKIIEYLEHKMKVEKESIEPNQITQDNHVPLDQFVPDLTKPLKIKITDESS